MVYNCLLDFLGFYALGDFGEGPCPYFTKFTAIVCSTFSGQSVSSYHWCTRWIVRGAVFVRFGAFKGWVITFVTITAEFKSRNDLETIVRKICILSSRDFARVRCNEVEQFTLFFVFV